MENRTDTPDPRHESADYNVYNNEINDIDDNINDDNDDVDDDVDGVINEHGHLGNETNNKIRPETTTIKRQVG